MRRSFAALVAGLCAVLLGSGAITCTDGHEPHDAPNAIIGHALIRFPN